MLLFIKYGLITACLTYIWYNVIGRLCQNKVTERQWLARGKQLGPQDSESVTFWFDKLSIDVLSLRVNQKMEEKNIPK